MGQNICSIKDDQSKVYMNQLLFNDSDLKVEEDGDNPSKQKLSNLFLKTQIRASWNILQQKNIMSQSSNSTNSYPRKPIRNTLNYKANQFIQNQSIQKQNQLLKDTGQSILSILNKKKYRDDKMLQYENIQIDVSSFIKIKKQNINDFYQFKEKVGEGTFGNVYRGIQKSTGQIRAIKALKKKAMSNNSKMCLIAELDLLKTLDHPNIIKLYDLYYYDDNYYVITQFCEGGCLQKYYSKNKEHITQQMIKIIMKQLISVLSYLYSVNIVHRDLKLQNIVFLKNQNSDKKDYQIKIIDFGTAIKVQKHKKNQSRLVGTLFYIAPQFTKGFFTQKCDIWSAGVILFLLFFHQFPFKGSNQKQILNSITSKRIQWDKLNKKCSKQAIQILKGMLDRNYLSRLSAKAIMQSQWMKQTPVNRASRQMTEHAASSLSNYNRKNNFVSMIQSFLCFKKITQQQRQQLSKMFFQIDNDHSGQIQTQKKFPEYTDANIKQIVQNLDKNNSGKIDFNEFITAMVQKTLLFVDQTLRQAFEYVDNDKTGFITKNEVKKLLKAGDKKQIQQLFILLDQNGDNQISFQQFKNYLKNS